MKSFLRMKMIRTENESDALVSEAASHSGSVEGTKRYQMLNANTIATRASPPYDPGLKKANLVYSWSR